MEFKTRATKKDDIERKWYIVDLKGKVLGRAAAEVAKVLMGKNKMVISQNADLGDNVIAINAKEIIVTGDKLDQKKYYSHSGYPGALKEMNLETAMERKPEWVFSQAVSGMLPKNKLRGPRIARLYVSADEKHDKIAQKPEELKV